MLPPNKIRKIDLHQAIIKEGLTNEYVHNNLIDLSQFHIKDMAKVLKHLGNKIIVVNEFTALFDTACFLKNNKKSQ